MKIINGLSIYILGLVLLLINQKVGLFDSSLFLSFLLIALINPLMVFVYDYLINPARLKSNFDWYYLAVIIVFLFQLFSAGVNLKIILIPPFILQLFIVMTLRRKKTEKKAAIYRLLFLPFITFGLLAVYIFMQFAFAPVP